MDEKEKKHNNANHNQNYIDSRNNFIKNINKEIKSLRWRKSSYKIEDFFTPDDVGEYIWLAVKKYIWESKVSILDPMWWSWNLLYQVVNKVWRDKFKNIYINRYNEYLYDDDDLYRKLKTAIETETETKIKIDKNNPKYSKKADIVVVNLANDFLGNHKFICWLAEQYAFILDTTKSPKSINNNFKLIYKIFLDSVWIDSKEYYLYIYGKNENNENNKTYKIKNDYFKNYNQKDNVFYKKKKEIQINDEDFEKYIEEYVEKLNKIWTVDVTIKKIFEIQNNIIKNYNNLLKTISEEWGFLDEYKTPYLMEKTKITEIITQIQLSWQKIQSKKLYEILTALTVSNFLILSWSSWVWKTSLVEKISNSIWWKFIKMPIKSNFTDESGLLGYYNPLLSQYESTEILAFLFNSSIDFEKPYFLLLDEMNLSRIENYFSEFLAIIDEIKSKDKDWANLKLFGIWVDNENKWKKIKSLKENLNIDLENFVIKNENNVELKENDNDKMYEKTDYFNIFKYWYYLELYCKIRSNLNIIWTINEDEITNSISNKVLDRAFYITLWVDDLFEDKEDKFLENMKDVNYRDITSKNILNLEKSQKELEKFKEFMNKINKYIQEINKNDAIWYRALQDIATYMQNYKENINNFDEKQILDLVFCQKVWPKIKNYSIIWEKETKFNELKSEVEKYFWKDSESYRFLESLNLF